LSFTSGIPFIAALCVLISIGIARLEFPIIRISLAFLIPIGLSYAVYYYPVMFLNHSLDQYTMWAGIFVSIWSLAGIIASFITILILRRDKTVKRR
ncbi:MAG: hypothetical protein P4L36_17450, partial [Holophaga sp.]|nr:hypothetical protein [Holophaga sp.]